MRTLRAFGTRGVGAVSESSHAGPLSSTTVEATEALISAELSMRNLVREVLGDEWREVPGLPTDEVIQERRRGEASNRPGVRINEDPLDFLFIRELRSILSQRRNRFGEVFPNQARFNAVIDLLTEYRNTPFHARNLTWFERDLVSGASGYITAAITHWRNAQDVDDELDYPSIISVSDEWGNELRHGTDPSSYGSDRSYEAISILDIGQTVRFTCRGSDADGRPLQWRLYAENGLYGSVAAQEVGEVAELSFSTTAEMVRPRHTVVVTLSIADSEYPPRHSYGITHNGYDDVRHGLYVVRRPRQRVRSSSVLS